MAANCAIVLTLKGDLITFNALIMSLDPSAIKHYDIELEGLDSCLLNTRYWQVYDHLKYLLDNPEKMKYYADNSKAKILLGWSPEISLAEGVQRTIEWKRQTMENLL